MPLRSDWSARPCPIARGIDALGDPWVLLVLREVVSGVCRFDEIREQLEVADNILAKRLAYMVEAGLLVRRPYLGGRKPRFEYVPTAAALDALPILHAYSVWGEKHTVTGDDDRRLVIVCRSCDGVSTQGEVCSQCGAVLSADNVSWIRPTSLNRVPVPLARDAALSPSTPGQGDA